MTRLLVLGMLDIQPLSGYDIQQMLRISDAERWGGVLIGSIYHALKKMESEGYIELKSIEQTGHRQKAVYSITDKGRDYLKALTLESLQSLSLEYPTALYSGLSSQDRGERRGGITGKAEGIPAARIRGPRVRSEGQERRNAESCPADDAADL
jgi:DNA-binding PadR family transcriptional regulator